MGMVSASFFGLDRPYYFVTVYVEPILVTLPKVIGFSIMCGKGYHAQTRKLYYQIRAVCMATLVICAIAGAIFGWHTITNNYTLEDCNTHEEGAYSEADYNQYQLYRSSMQAESGISLPSYESYEDWVHGGLTADECAMQTVFSTTIGLVLGLLFQIHFFLVAKSFWLEKVDPLPEDSDAPRDWDPAMYRDRQTAQGQPQYEMADMNSGQKHVQAIPVGMPGQQNAQPIQGYPAMGMAGQQVMGQPMGQPMG